MSNAIQTKFDTPEEFEQFKVWLLGVLRDGVTKDLRITFTKTDGSEREMHCTLCESRIPAEKQPKSEGTGSTSSGSAVRVFDTEKGEWRSFRWDSLIKVEFEL